MQLLKIEMTARSIVPTLLPMVEKTEQASLPVRYPEFAARLQKAMSDAKVSVSDIKRTLNVTYEMARRYALGQAMPRPEKMDALAALLNRPAAELMFGPQKGDTLVATPPEIDHQINAEEVQPIGPRRFAPIVGIGQGGPDGYLSIDDYPPGQGDGEILTSSTDRHAYAIRVRGDSMRPRIRSGEYVIAEPSFEAQPGDDVVVKLKDGRALVKEMLFITGDEVRLGSVNDDVPPITIGLENVSSIHRIAAIVPRASAVLRTATVGFSYTGTERRTGVDRRLVLHQEAALYNVDEEKEDEKALTRASSRVTDTTRSQVKEPKKTQKF